METEALIVSPTIISRVALLLTCFPCVTGAQNTVNTEEKKNVIIPSITWGEISLQRINCFRKLRKLAMEDEHLCFVIYQCL